MLMHRLSSAKEKPWSQEKEKTITDEHMNASVKSLPQINFEKI